MKQVRAFVLLSFATAAIVLPSQAAYAAKPGETRLYIGTQLGDSVVGGLLGLQINKSFSLEARYDHVDTVREGNTTTEASTVGLTGIGMYPVKFGKMNPFYIFLKAGYEQTTTEESVYDPGIPGLFEPSTTVTTTERRRTVVGAGVHRDFSRSVSGRIGMNAVGSDHTVFLTAIYKF